MSAPPIFAIVGPTAAGKTRAAFELAARVGGEIISVDSRQVYRHMDVGTDKISRAEMKIVPHHLIDVADPDEAFTAADFVRLASAAASRIAARGKAPILAGGSPMYYKALEGKMLTDMLPRDDAVRARLEGEAKTRGVLALHGELAEVDPISASRIHPNDKFRILRALELFRLTGKSATSLYAEGGKIGGMNVFYFGVSLPRERLYEKIALRVESQFRSGYPEEVKWLLDNGYSPELPSMRGFGYRELAEFLCGRATLEGAMEGDIRSTKAFSRRQMTWFKQFYPILWYDLSEITLDKAVGDMAEKISRIAAS
ncbi:MAG: tRNA (adenosine(37)-N6)-dimethylallyltransferase MiaA [Synergistaceae bacterium]|jgi:tRNA dimethylallyltransferase|nr:tRNA (adenosine(37)-N6)-dimethylallyltransferase MiaA [Synergistaceae bacterium]